MNFHYKYNRISPWWRFIRQEFELIIAHRENVGIFDRAYKDKFIELTAAGILIMKPGFKFSASGPTIDTKSSRRASCTHDGLYTISKNGGFKGCCSETLKDISDKILYRMCVEDGMWQFRARAWLLGVDYGADDAWEANL